MCKCIRASRPRPRTAAPSHLPSYARKEPCMHIESRAEPLKAFRSRVQRPGRFVQSALERTLARARAPRPTPAT
eukprot:8187157-Lingulodinium_polyedra.AAC.1